MNGPLSGFWASPKIRANCVQLEIRIGVLIGPPGARPTKAATAVPTPSMGLFAEGISSTYTPGVRYVGMSLLHSACRPAVRQFAMEPAGEDDEARAVSGRIEHLH